MEGSKYYKFELPKQALKEYLDEGDADDNDGEEEEEEEREGPNSNQLLLPHPSISTLVTARSSSYLAISSMPVTISQIHRNGDNNNNNHGDSNRNFYGGDVFSITASPQLSSSTMASSYLDKKISLYKTEMCRSLQETGFCKYGPRCQFAHAPQELRPVKRHPKYKTVICKTFWEQGSCPYGKRCCFIHNELSSSLPANIPGTQPNTTSRLDSLEDCPEAGPFSMDPLETNI